MRKIIIFLFSCVACLLVVSCETERTDFSSHAAYKMSEICVGQKKFFKAKGRYGTLSDLYTEGLVTDDLRNHHKILDKEFYGYVFEIKTAENGYVAKANPIGYGTKDSTSRTSFYADEKSKVIHARYDGIQAGRDSPEYQSTVSGGTMHFSCEE